MPPMVRCGLTTFSTNLTPFLRSAVGAKMLRPRPGTTSARRLTGSWAPWLSRMVNDMMPVPTPWIVCFPAVVISFGVENSLNSCNPSFSPGISSSSRKGSNAPLSSSSVAPLVLGVNCLVAAAVNTKPSSKSLLLPVKLMTGFSLSGDSFSLAAAVVSAVDLLFPEEQCAQLAHARETLAFLFGCVAPWLWHSSSLCEVVRWTEHHFAAPSGLVLGLNLGQFLLVCPRSLHLKQ